MRITEAMMQTSITEERNRLQELYREDVPCLQAALGPAAAQDMLVEIHAELVRPKEPGRTVAQHQATVGAMAMAVLEEWTGRAINSQMAIFDPWADACVRLAEQSK